MGNCVLSHTESHRMLNALRQSELCRQVPKALGHGILKPAKSHMKKRRKKPLVLGAGVGNTCLSSCNKGIGVGEVLDLKSWQSLTINTISMWQGAGISKHS